MLLLVLENIVFVNLVGVHDVNSMVHEHETQEENHLFATRMRFLDSDRLHGIHSYIRCAHNNVSMVV